MLLFGTVADQPDEWLAISNGLSNENETFWPILWGADNRTQTAGGATKHPALYLLGSVSADQDENDLGQLRPIIGFDARLDYNTEGAGSAVVNRPLFSWNNWGETRMLMDAEGNLGLNTGSINGPTARFHSNGSVRFENLTVDNFPDMLTIDPAGNVARSPIPPFGNTTLNCTLTTNVPVVTGTDVLGCSNIWDTGTRVGIGANNPLADLHVFDMDGSGAAIRIGTGATVGQLRVTGGDFRISAEMTNNNIRLQAPSGADRMKIWGATGRIGVGSSTAPGNRFEITSQTNDPAPSGLRFTNLTNGSPAPSGNGKVLSVNGQGDVILVQDSVASGGSGSTNACATIGVLPRTVSANGDMDCSQVIDDGTTVGVGTATLSHDTKLMVDMSNTVAGINIGLRSDAKATDNSIYRTNAVLGNAWLLTVPTNSSTATRTAGVAGVANIGMLGGSTPSGNNTWNAYGTHGRVYLSDKATCGWAYGAFGEVGQNGGGSTTLEHSFGTYGRAALGRYRHGAYGSATQAGADDNYGVFGSADNGTNNYSIYGEGGQDSNDWAVYADGATFSTTQWSTSDEDLKSNIRDLEGSLARIMELEPKRYTYNTSLHPGMHLPEGEQMGLIAQRVQQVLPTLVRKVHHPDQFNSEGELIEKGFDFMAMSYTGLIPVMVGAIKEQQTIIEEQKARISKLEEDMAELKDLVRANGIPVADGKLTGRLEQNMPNPASESTTIRFYVPTNAKQAGISVFDADGRIVKSFERLAIGQGQLVIEAGTLEAGSYTYTLLVDGAKVDAKTMVITR